MKSEKNRICEMSGMRTRRSANSPNCVVVHKLKQAKANNWNVACMGLYTGEFFRHWLDFIFFFRQMGIWKCYKKRSREWNLCYLLCEVFSGELHIDYVVFGVGGLTIFPHLNWQLNSLVGVFLQQLVVGAWNFCITMVKM